MTSGCSIRYEAQVGSGLGGKESQQLSIDGVLSDPFLEELMQLTMNPITDRSRSLQRFSERHRSRSGISLSHFRWHRG